MPYVERPDIAFAGARAVNESISPSILTSTSDNFGVQDTAIFFYNVSPMEFNEPRYPNHPHMLIKACPPGEEYVMARGSITHPFREIREDSNQNKYPFLVSGYREAAKMLNPLNPGTDQDWNEANSLHKDGNLNRFGVFWSVNNPPTKEELAAARRRMEETFKAELQEMVAIEAKEGPDGARARANNVSRAAANYFNQSYSWHRLDLVPKDVNTNKVDCGVCGEKIMPTAKLCVHCGAPTDPEKQDKWLESRFAEKRPVGRPASV